MAEDNKVINLTDTDKPKDKTDSKQNNNDVKAKTPEELRKEKRREQNRLASQRHREKLKALKGKASGNPSKPESKAAESVTVIPKDKPLEPQKNKPWYANAGVITAILLVTAIIVIVFIVPLFRKHGKVDNKESD